MTKKQILSYWSENLRASGLRQEIVNDYLDYITPIIYNGVPVIFNFDHLCKLMGRTNIYLASVVNSSNDNHYRTFTIPKKSKGSRDINAPYPALLECQYWIYNNILKKIKVHPTAQAFTFNKSIITNAKIHVNQDEFLKIDLKDFFPSIKINRIIGVFKSLGYTHIVSFYLASICSMNYELPQGAPTSPILSNIICTAMDIRLFALAQKFSLKYTRYADDMAFSGVNIPSKFIEYVAAIVNDFDFAINESKTILHKTKSKRILTGISIVNQSIKVPREYKRQLKQDIHFIKKYGLASHIRKKKIRHPFYLQSITGKVIFWLSVEPDNKEAKEALVHLKMLLNNAS